MTQDTNRMNYKIMIASLVLAGGAVFLGNADEAETRLPIVQSIPGSNAWNQGMAPADWQMELSRYHGHVGPWNVIGWRMGQAALKEFQSEWGRHELEFIGYVPMQTPFTCLIDGLSVGTGNSQGRMDLRLAEILHWREIFVAVRRKDGKGGVLEFRPQLEFVKSIMGLPSEKLEAYCRQALRLEDKQLFARQWIRD